MNDIPDANTPSVIAESPRRGRPRKPPTPPPTPPVIDLSPEDCAAVLDTLHTAVSVASPLTADAEVKAFVILVCNGRLQVVTDMAMPEAGGAAQAAMNIVREKMLEVELEQLRLINSGVVGRA